MIFTSLTLNNWSGIKSLQRVLLLRLGLTTVHLFWEGTYSSLVGGTDRKDWTICLHSILKVEIGVISWFRVKVQHRELVCPCVKSVKSSTYLEGLDHTLNVSTTCILSTHRLLDGHTATTFQMWNKTLRCALATRWPWSALNYTSSVEVMGKTTWKIFMSWIRTHALTSKLNQLKRRPTN